LRQDQYEKIQEISERLADVVIADADPVNWTGDGKLPKELTKDERGDAYWCRKMAVATLSVMMRVSNLIGVIQRQTNDGSEAGVVEDEALLDAEVAAAEKEANRLLDKLNNRKGHLQKFKSANEKS